MNQHSTVSIKNCINKDFIIFINIFKCIKLNIPNYLSSVIRSATSPDLAPLDLPL